MSDNTMPAISVPVNIAEKVKKFGSLSLKPCEIKSVLDAFVNCVIEEVSEGNQVVIPKAFKFSRSLLKERTFYHPRDRTLTSVKEARYAMKITVMPATKVAFEELEVNDNGEVVTTASDAEIDDDADADADAEEPKAGKGKAKVVKAVKPAPKPKAKGKGKAAKKSEIEEADADADANANANADANEVSDAATTTDVDEEPAAKKKKTPAFGAKKAPKVKEPKEPKEKKAPAPKKEKKTPAAKKVKEADIELVEEVYDDVDNFSDEN